MKYLLKLLIVILLCVPSMGYAFQNEPDGFRDLQWGESLEEVEQNRKVKYLAYDENSNSVMYAVMLNSNETKTISGVPIWMNTFMATFWNNKLWDIQMFCEGETSFSSLRRNMVELYGVPDINKWDSCLWVGDTTMILLDIDKQDGNSTRIRIISKEIFNNISKERAQLGW